MVVVIRLEFGLFRSWRVALMRVAYSWAVWIEEVGLLAGARAGLVALSVDIFVDILQHVDFTG